jgi:2-keto-3-deoxy-L-rhamnonate aldolase RhmA
VHDGATDATVLIRDFAGRLKAGPMLGAWSSLGHAAVSTILSRSGVDWLVLDAEHGMFSPDSIRACLDAAQPTGIPTLVRVPANDATVLKTILDLGPDGVVIPMVNTADDARAAVAACRYPPEGRRGFGAGRGAVYGLEYARYAAMANDALAIVVQIEHVDGVANVDEIAVVPGLTGLFIGPTDLSASMGLLNQTGHPRMREAIATVIEAGARAGVPVGSFCGSEAEVIERIAAGVRFVAWTNDLGLLAEAASGSVARIRAGLATT